MGARVGVVKLLATEDVRSSNFNPQVAMLAGARGAQIQDLAGPALDDDVSIFLERSGLHKIGAGGTGLGRGGLGLGHG